MKKWRRTSSSGRPSIAATCHLIEEVETDGDDLIVHFATAPASVGSAFLMELETSVPTGAIVIEGTNVRITYDSDPSGQTWNAFPGLAVWTDGTTICPGQTGNT